MYAHITDAVAHMSKYNFAMMMPMAHDKPAFHVDLLYSIWCWNSSDFDRGMDFRFQVYNVLRSSLFGHVSCLVVVMLLLVIGIIYLFRSDIRADHKTDDYS